MSHLNRLWSRLEILASQSAWARYGFAIGFVLVTVLMRAVLDPLFGPNPYYHLFYPAVILSAYGFGARAGLLALVLSSFAGYFVFAAPTFHFKTTLQPHLPLFTFVLSAFIAIFVLTHVRARLRHLTTNYARIDALTQSQADLFREHAERVSNHLQLISALLQLEAQEEGRAMRSRVLMNAASRTMLISRMHRSFAQPDGESIDFRAFAERLTHAALAARGRPPVSVTIQGRLNLPLEQATSLGLVLLECINARAARAEPGAIRLTLTEQGDDGVFSLIDETANEPSARDTELLRAIAEQMRGSLIMGIDEAHETLHLAFPTALQPLPKWDPVQPLN